MAKTYLRPDQRGVIRYLNGFRTSGQHDRNGPRAGAARGVHPLHRTGRHLASESERQAPPPVAAPVQAQLPSPGGAHLTQWPAGHRRAVVEPAPGGTADLVFRSGGANDPANLPGAMSTTAGLVTEGAGGRSAQDIARATEALGAVLSSGSGSEASWVSVNAMPDKSPPRR